MPSPAVTPAKVKRLISALSATPGGQDLGALQQQAAAAVVAHAGGPGVVGAPDKGAVPEGDATQTSTVPTPTITHSELAKHVPDDIYHTIVRIVVHATEFDFELPFKIKGNQLSSGTGFFIDKQGHILTCSHVVQDASHVYIEIPNEGKKQYKAQVLGICPFFDIAIIRILDYQNTHCCTLDEAIGHSVGDAAVKSGDETYALGFPLGQDNLKVTKGIVSGQQQRMYQIDTPINPGNSGGPLLKNGKVIGINGAGVLLANNIGYAVPIARYFLVKDLMYEPKRLVHYPELFGFEYQRTCQEFIDFFGYKCGGSEEEAVSPARGSKRASKPANGRRSLRRSSPVKTATKSTGGCKTGGIYVKRTFRKSPIAATRMQEGDFVCALNGVSVDHYGEFDQRWMNQKMDMSNMLSTLPLGKKVTVDFWSNKKKQRVQKRFVMKEYAMPIRQVYPQFETVDYEVLGGVVVMPLTLNHLEGLFVQGSFTKYKDIERRHEPKLLVSAVLMGSYLAQQRTLVPNEVLKEVNDCKVSTMADLRQALAKPLRKGKRHYLKLFTEDRNTAILPLETLHKEEPHLQEVYKYAPSKVLGRLARV